MARSTSGKRALAAGSWGEQDYDTAVEIARRYYLEGQSRVDIAKDLELTRFQVARILQEALSSGLVRIEIGRPGLPDPELGEALAGALGIERAVVIRTTGASFSTTLSQIARQLASFVAEAVPAGATLGLSWSRTLDAMAHTITDLPPCTVVQLAGHLHLPGQGSSSVEIVRRVASVSGGTAFPIYAPMLVDDATTAIALRRLPEVAEALARVSHVDVAVASIGGWDPSSSQLFDALPPRAAREATALGAVGEVVGRVFDEHGNPIELLDDRVIAATLAELRAVPHVILSGFGEHRARATVAAVRATGAHTLVADEALARAILDSEAHVNPG
ncbi:MAG: sugar-binding transcriptional regulator [Protaetiibacter sp.]